MRPKRQPVPAPPSDTELLAPEWFTIFSVYWPGCPRPARERILQLLAAAMQEATAERSIYQLQHALRELGLIETQIIKLILIRYLDHIYANTDRPAQRIAAEVLATLLEIHRGRTGRRRR